MSFYPRGTERPTLIRSNGLRRHGIHYYPLSFGTSRHLLNLFMYMTSRPLKGKKVICLPVVVVRKENWKKLFFVVYVTYVEGALPTIT
jgi:hypothetical protein